VTDEQSVHECVSEIQKESGGIDILVNNAGYGSYGSLEEVPLHEARRQVEVNLFGLAALTQLAIPHMRKKRWGRIINVTSIGGVNAFPYGGWYHATKFAVEGLSSALRQELSPFDVDVVIIRPGAIKTEWSDIAARSLIEVSGSGPYAKAARALHTLFTSDRLAKAAADPSVIADVVEKAVASKHPRSVYTAPFAGRMMVRIQRWAGFDCLRDKMTRSFMGLPKRM
jgi:NAD(P)-dependent dehydrogenase (short-subunit alcohol dehydrogenase family)